MLCITTSYTAYAIIRDTSFEKFHRQYLDQVFQPSIAIHDTV